MNTHLGSPIKSVRPTKPLIHISLPQISQPITKNFLHNNLIITRQLRLPNEISPRRPTKSPIHFGQFTNLRRVQVPHNLRRAALRQVPKAGLRRQRRAPNWVCLEEREAGTHSQKRSNLWIQEKERKKRAERKTEEVVLDF